MFKGSCARRFVVAMCRVLVRFICWHWSCVQGLCSNVFRINSCNFNVDIRSIVVGIVHWNCTVDALSSSLWQFLFEVQRFSMVQTHHVVSVLSLTWLADSAAKEFLAFELQLWHKSCRWNSKMFSESHAQQLSRLGGGQGNSGGWWVPILLGRQAGQASFVSFWFH